MNTEKEQELREQVVEINSRARSNTYRIDGLEEEVKSFKKSETLIQRHEEEIKELKVQAASNYKLAVNQESMAHTLKTMADDNRRQMDNFDATLNNINESLITMNTSQQQMNNEIQNMQKEIVSTKSHVKEVEALAEKNRDKGKIDFLAILTNDAPKAIALALIAAILTYLGVSK